MHRNRSQVTTAAPILIGKKMFNVLAGFFLSSNQKQVCKIKISTQHNMYRYNIDSDNTYTFLGEMHKYSICQRANSKSICRYFKIRRRYLYCMEVDKHLERFFDGEEYDEFAGSGNMTIKQFNLFKNQANNRC